MVEAGNASGLAIKLLFRFVEGDQLKLIPVALVGDPPIGMVSPMQIEVSFPASTEGREFREITTVSVSVQEFASVTVTVKVVLIEGNADGLKIFTALNPVDGLQE